MLQVFNQQHSPSCTVCFGSSHHISSWKVVLVENFPLVSDHYWRRGYNPSVFSGQFSAPVYPSPSTSSVLPSLNFLTLWGKTPIPCIYSGICEIMSKICFKDELSIKELAFSCWWSLLVQSIQLCLCSECVCFQMLKR